MERDSIIENNERLMLSSDPHHEVQVCRACGLLGYFNNCSTCENGDNIATIKLTYAGKLLIQEVTSMSGVSNIRLTEA